MYTVLTHIGVWVKTKINILYPRCKFNIHYNNNIGFTQIYYCVLALYIQYFLDLCEKNEVFVLYKLSHKREWNTEKYSASASHIQRGRRLKAELDMGRRRAIFFRISTSARVITYLSSSKLARDIEHTIRMVVILAVQYRFLSPLHSASLIGGLART